MYHLGQQQFLEQWKKVQDQNVLIVAENTSFLEVIRDTWVEPQDWYAGIQEDGSICLDHTVKLPDEGFLFTKCKSYQEYHPHKSLWNRIEDGKLFSGQLLESSVLVVNLADILQDQEAYGYLKQVLQSGEVSEWHSGTQLIQINNVLPTAYEGRVILWGAREWQLVWEQMDSAWARKWVVLKWPEQCEISDEIHREFDDQLPECTVLERQMLWDMQRRGADERWVWADLGRIVHLRQNVEQSIEAAIKSEEEWWQLREEFPKVAVGNIAGAAVLSRGEHRIGLPIRIQAVISTGGSRSLENYCGPIYSKSVEIIKEYWASLGGRRNFVLQMEQNYNYLEGDSAAAAQFYAILSAATGRAPLPGVAVTGAINLYGDILSVGGITEKIEGCYRCGGSGMIFPKENEKDLILRPSVQKAVEEGRFRLWAVERIEEGAAILFQRSWKKLIRKI